MSLDTSKLQNVVKKSNGNLVAQCPACAAEGHDKQGDHLFLSTDGKFGCIKHPDDKEHNQQIWKLAGQSESPAPTRRKVALTIRAYRTPKSKVISTIPRWTFEELGAATQAKAPELES